MAFLDSGFYPHPDLTQPESRILTYTSTEPEDASEEAFRTPNVESWHGTMTSVVAAGSGYLSGGRYRGIASDSNLVLVKVGGPHGLHNADIIRGLEWVIAHREEYAIRIVNISAGGDEEASYLYDPLSRLVEDAIRAGLVVVCASGNAGHTPGHEVLPPASVPAAITVGGINDRNNLDLHDSEMYRSSYGPTVDGLQKPEVVAPSMWLAAPILPGTDVAKEADLLGRLRRAEDKDLHEIIAANAGISAELDAAIDQSAEQIRTIISARIADEGFITRNYKYVDGTSFAAPIVSSIVAQMLEANPVLTPMQVKAILIRTAERLPDVPIDQQGWGTVISGRAVEVALQMRG
jgi:serine protease AprX